MAKTPISGTSSYASAEAFLLRFDERTVGDLLSVDGANRLTRAQVIASDKLAAWLKEASGELESAIFLGGKYTTVDLAALAGTNAGEMVSGLVCDLAGWRMYDFRPDRKSEMPERCKEAKERIGRIEAGEQFLAFQESADASRMDHDETSPQEVDDRNGVITEAAAYFGRRLSRTERQY